jgi:hypothetical protein
MSLATIKRALGLKMPGILPDFTEIWIFLADFNKSTQYPISPKSLYWKPR